MRRSNTLMVIASIMAVFALLAGALVVKGGLYVSLHDGDMLHLFDIVFRMEAGQVPHRDFVTPIGILAVWPIWAFLDMGFGIGMAFILAQVAVGLLVVAAGIWIGLSRLSTGWAIFLGVVLTALSLAVIHGTSQSQMSLSMHYNRWAWAVAFVAIAIGFLPPLHRQNRWLDALLLGLAMTVLGMMKATYVAAFAPAIIAMLFLRGAVSTLVASLGVTALAAGAITLVIGVDGWVAYIGDLITVSQSPFREYPSAPLAQVITAPAYLSATLLGVAAVMLMRLGGRLQMGLGLVLLVPGFVYATYQNYGNDPQWLMLLAVLVAASLPEKDAARLGHVDLRQASVVSVVAMLALAMPSLSNMALSPLRNLAQDPEIHTLVFPNAPQHDDLFIFDDQANRYDLIVAGDGPGSGMEPFRELANRKVDDVAVNGEALEFCGLKSGILAFMHSVAAELEQAGFAEGNTILAADLLQVFYMFSDGLEPVPGGAPWTYGGLPGLDAADYVLIPFCPIAPHVRAHFLTGIEEAGLSLDEVYRSPLFILAEVTGWEDTPPEDLQLSAASTK